MNKMRKPLGVIFDFAGTVLSHGDIDVIGGNRRLYELAGNKNRVSFEDVRQSVEKVTDWIEPLKNASMVELNCETLNRLIYAPLGLTFALTPAELEKEFWNASLKYSPVPGIYELLDLLELNNVKTGILSNSMYCARIQEEELAGITWLTVSRLSSPVPITPGSPFLVYRHQCRLRCTQAASVYL
jgi:FMN phosphatase YigB (HAD superfamily)